MRFPRLSLSAIAALALLAATPTRAADDDDTFRPDEVTNAAADFFGITTEAVAKAVQRVFKDQGQPDAYIKGDEGSGAVVVGLRYGAGWLIRKHADPIKVYWKGPSVGFDVGGNASKFFALVYNLKRENRLYQRFPERGRQLLFRRRYRRELSAQRRRHRGTDADWRRPARRRQCGLSRVFAGTRLVSVLAHSFAAAGSSIVPAGAGR